MSEHKPDRALVICQEPISRHITTVVGVIEVMPVKTFFEKLWDSEIIK